MLLQLPPEKIDRVRDSVVGVDMRVPGPLFHKLIGPCENDISHAADREELKSKPLFRKLLELSVFDRCVTIRSMNGQRSYEVEDL